MRKRWLPGLMAAVFLIGLVGGTNAGADHMFSRRGEQALQAMKADQLPFRAHAVSEPAATKLERTDRKALSGAPGVAEPVGKLDAKLAKRLAVGPDSDQKIRVLVQTKADPAQVSKEAQITVDRLYSKALSGFAASLTKQEILALQQVHGVEVIQEDQVVTTQLDRANEWTGARQAREDFMLSGDGDGYAHSYSSSDVVIAVVDTGIDGNHKDLAGKVIAFHDVINNQTEAYDDNGHGTHVASIAAGAGNVSRSMRGAAPGAALVGVKVLSGEGSGTMSGVIAGIEWVIDNKDKYNIRVMKMNRTKVLQFQLG